MHRLNLPKKLTLIDSIICTSLFYIFTGCAPKDENRPAIVKGAIPGIKQVLHLFYIQSARAN